MYAFIQLPTHSPCLLLLLLLHALAPASIQNNKMALNHDTPVLCNVSPLSNQESILNWFIIFFSLQIPSPGLNPRYKRDRKRGVIYHTTDFYHALGCHELLGPPECEMKSSHTDRVLHTHTLFFLLSLSLSIKGRTWAGRRYGIKSWSEEREKGIGWKKWSRGKPSGGDGVRCIAARPALWPQLPNKLWFSLLL